MLEWDLSGSESQVQDWDVKKDCDKGGLEEDSEVTHCVNHTLLGEREVSSLADHQVSPLHGNDGDEVS